MLCYWISNNLLTMAQTGLLKTPWVRRQFGIWDAPKPVPGLEPETLTATASKLLKKILGEATSDKQKIEQHNQAVEVKKKAKAFHMMRLGAKTRHYWKQEPLIT